MRVNENPVVKLTLQVTPQGLPMFEATTRSTISIVTLSQVSLKPGSVLAVKVNPAKPTNFVIDWNATIAQQSGTPATVSTF